MCLGLPLGARVCSLHLLSGTGRDSYARFTDGETEARGRPGGADCGRSFSWVSQGSAPGLSTVLPKECRLVESE